jgi:hypothetical protein
MQGRVRILINLFAVLLGMYVILVLARRAKADWRGPIKKIGDFLADESDISINGLGNLHGLWPSENY